MPTKNPHPKIDGIRIDIEALRRLSHQCQPANCSIRGNCCKTYEVIVDNGEISGIVGTMPRAAHYAKGLVQDGELIDPFDEADDADACLATHHNGMCVFAWRDRKGATRCSLHSAALDLGVDPYDTKPKACTLWPLYLIEGNSPVLTVQEDTYSFDCNKPAAGRPTGLNPGISEILDSVFGGAFRENVERLLTRK
ncbi:MAG: hypothetical protein QGG73_13630 [Candidatus Hydrogenedentes bacterium]|jgi:hypothetical protein|nr:hypothetical protein [Candidatus Hydrogenedentota bacterium]